ncbi:outer membrane beta-barrel protein [Mucilaginibacter endophyticus]|uniref:outer membrane beta-barrel protein n=1 Tax=Mucilaginibacter endophyticus TaxID=2675003 RepID=UPI000E0D9681|nr:outer membrane beta-barrel protein [Mucilaginibacter endophyticus]
MKLPLTLSFLLLLACLKLSAQTKAIQFGIKAGIATTSLSRTPGTDIKLDKADKSGFGYFAGAFASFNFNRFSLQPAIIFNALSSQSSQNAISGDIIYRTYGKWRLYYLQVPVNLIYNIPVQGGGFYVGAGPYIANALSGRFTPAVDPVLPNASSLAASPPFNAKFGNDDFSNFKRFDYGANAVAGFALNSGFMINAVYNLGIANIQGNDRYIYESTKTRSLGIALGYKF